MFNLRRANPRWLAFGAYGAALVAYAVTAFSELLGTRKLGEIGGDWVSILSLLAAPLAAIGGVIIGYYYLNQQRTRNPSQIYLSYSIKDKPAIDAIRANLLEHGFQLWDATHDIRAGENWAEALRNAIANSAVALIFLSKNFEAGEFSQNESRYILNSLRGNLTGASPVIVYCIDNLRNFPSDLLNVTYIDGSSSDGLDRLISELRLRVKRD